MTARDEAIPLVMRIGGDGDVEAIAPAIIAAATGAAPTTDDLRRDAERGVLVDAAPIDQDSASLLTEGPSAGIPVDAASVAEREDVILARDPISDARGVRLLDAPIDQDRLLAAFGEDRQLPLAGGLGQPTLHPLDGVPGI